MNILLLPVAMKVPNAKGVYALTTITQPMRVTLSDVLQMPAMTRRTMLISFEPDGVSNPQKMFGYSLNGVWYIIR